MSSSEEASNTEKGRLEATAPTGVAIAVTHGPFKEVARGFGAIRQDLPSGIYTVRWNSAGRLAEDVVVVSPRAPTILSYNDELDRRDADEVEEGLRRASTVGADLVVFVSRHFVEAQSNPGKSEDYASASESDRGRPKRSCASDFRLRSRKGDRSSEPIEVFSLKSSLVICFTCDPGSYLLRYKSVDRLSVEQTVHIYDGRTTLLLMKLTRAARPEKAKDDVRFRSREGIDPVATRMTTADKFGPWFGLEVQIRLASTLLERLARGGRTIEPELQDAIDLEQDPCVRMFAAALLLGQEPPTAAVRWSVEPQVSSKVRSLMNWVPGADPSPDEGCILWRLALADPSEGYASFRSPVLPPMLDRCLQWASAWSGFNPRGAEFSVEFAAAATGRVASTPWLVWRRKVSSDEQVADSSVLDSIEDIAETFANNIKSFSEVLANRSSATDRPPRSFELPNVDLSQFSSSTLKLTSSALRFGIENLGGKELLEGLSLALKAPATVIAQQMQTANNEVVKAESSGYETTGSHFSSDPLKGQFGGSATANGYTLRLHSWTKSNNPEFLGLDIEITRSPDFDPPTGIVKFYLHPTFNPSIEPALWNERRALITIYAMGAFTLGAETDDRTRLELDLANDTYLPKWFRDR